MADALTPTEGARFLLERVTDDGACARYRTAIYTPGATYESFATLRDDGTVEIEPSTAPEELSSTLEMLAKLTARSAAKKREDGLPPWPARVLRWRGPGRGE
ncbi:MAG TPA: hypothetical protein VFV99_19960 [Kofleriaceae bacterium]|nr:hypothetical protein [Kofleriaceae bacterium]